MKVASQFADLLNSLTDDSAYTIMLNKLMYLYMVVCGRCINF